MDYNKLLFKWIFYSTLKIRREWFIDEIDDLFRSQYESPEILHEIQKIRLNKLISHACLNVPYYRRYIKQGDLDPADITCLPFLEKEQIRSDPELFISGNKNGQRVKVSGGSTGAPVTIYKNPGGMAKEMAAAWRGYNWAGIEIGDRQVRFWGVPRSIKDNIRAKLIDFACNRKRVTAFGYSEETFRTIVNKIKIFRPDYFYGYASLITEFARFLINQNKIGEIELKAVITTSEVLSTSDRALIEKAFKSKVFDEYGCGEVGTIAHECEFGRMHINSENLIVEVIDGKGRGCKPGEPGELVVTDLINFSMPLIRYRLKDFATLSDEVCPCNRTLPVLQKIHGRQYDYLVNNKGQKFHGEFFLYIAEDARKSGIPISAIQFIQGKNLDIKVRVVSTVEGSRLLKSFISSRIEKDFDKDVNVLVESVNNIEREQSGKLRVVKREFGVK